MATAADEDFFQSEIAAFFILPGGSASQGIIFKAHNVFLYNL